MTLFFLFQNIALTYTLAANVSVLVSVAPLFTALVSRLFLNEKLKANFFLGFAAAITGIILIAFNGSLVLKLNPIGELLAILAALSWAFYNVAIRKVSPERSGVFYLTRKVFTYGLLLTLPFLPLFDFQLGLERLAVLPNLLNLLFLGVVASALCYVSWNYAVQLLGPTKTSVYIYLVPVVTIVFSALVLNETITLVAGIGMALILLGIALSEREKACWCARKRCQMARGRAERRSHKDCQRPLSQAARALAVWTAPVTVHCAPGNLRRWETICLQALSTVPLPII